MKCQGFQGRGPAPEGDGAARTGSRPRWIWHWRATPRPTSCHLKPSLLSVGMTSVKIGCGGRYLLSRLAVWPARQHDKCEAHCRQAHADWGFLPMFVQHAGHPPFAFDTQRCDEDCC